MVEVQIFKKDIVEYIGNSCYIPSSGNCFIKCINYLTGNDFTEEFLTFIRMSLVKFKRNKFC